MASSKPFAQPVLSRSISAAFKKRIEAAQQVQSFVALWSPRLQRFGRASEIPRQRTDTIKLLLFLGWSIHTHIYMVPPPPETPRLSYLDCTSWSLLPLTAFSVPLRLFVSATYYLLLLWLMMHGAVECSGWGSHAMMVAMVISDRFQCRTQAE